MPNKKHEGCAECGKPKPEERKLCDDCERTGWNDVFKKTREVK